MRRGVQAAARHVSPPKGPRASRNLKKDLALTDDREFPTLSGNAQPQFTNTNNPIWQRPAQQTPVQRPPQQPHPNTTQNPPPNQQHPASPSNDDMFIGSSHLQGSLDDYRQTNQNQMPSRQPPSQSIDDFPPLGRNGTDEHANEQSRFGFAAQPSFSAQDTNQRTNTFASQADSTRSSSVVNRTLSPGGNRPQENPSNNLSSLLSNFNPRSSSANQQQPPMSDFDNRIPEQKIEQMNDADRYGLAGFLARINSKDPMVAGLARGQDLTQLGLNLNSSE